MRSLRLEQSFTLATAAVVVVLLGVTLFAGHVWIAAALERSLAARAESVARSIGAVAAPALVAYNYPALQAAADGALGDPDLCHVMVFDKEGRIAGLAGDGRADGIAEGWSTQGLEPRVRKLEHPDGARIVEVLEVTVPVRIEGSPHAWGAVRVGLGFDRLESEIARLELVLVLFGSLLVVLAAICARLAARGITAPLRRLAHGTEALAQGDLTHQIEVTGARELAELTHAFNSMIERVRNKAAESEAYQQELARLNATLERQVLERTRALEESVERYRTLVEQSPEAIVIVQGGRVRFVNSSFESTFGVAAAAATHAEFRLEALFDDDSAAALRSRVAAWAAGQKSGPVEVAARGADGSPRCFELRGSGIEYFGEPAAECLLLDTTEAKRLREHLADTERLRSLGELATGVAHDFNNLLAAILGRVQLLRQRGAASDVDERDLAVIEQAALDGRQTVLRIQEFCGTRVDRELGAVDLSTVLRGALDMTRPRWKTEAARAGVAIQVHADLTDAAPVRGSASELREVFVNLILNALDAMPAGGELRVRATVERDDQVVATVEDTGGGMSEDVRRRIFDPFFSTKGVSGLGLGMSVAYGIVKRHRGEIEVHSEPGCGSRFVVRLPLAERGPGAASLADEAQVARIARARILVIDDETAITQLLVDVLAIDGHSVDVAHSGAAGVELATAQAYDAVLTDLGMPDMSGWEVSRRIREAHPAVPVVLVTGWGASVTAEERERAGLSAVVNKPFEIQPLLATVAEVLALARGASPVAGSL